MTNAAIGQMIPARYTHCFRMLTTDLPRLPSSRLREIFADGSGRFWVERLTYDRAAKSVTYRSDKAEGPTAGTETLDPRAFLARVLVHIPDKGTVTTRCYGWYANRPRGMRRQGEPAAAEAPLAIVTTPRLAPTEATRRWAALLRQIFEVDPLRCPTCHGTMRIVAVITQRSVIDQILAHLGTRTTAAARSPPSPRASTAWGAARRRTATPAS